MSIDSLIDPHQGNPDSIRAEHALGETLHIWRQRYQDRQELARWTDRDLHDVGLSWSDIANEVDKPFWRA